MQGISLHLFVSPHRALQPEGLHHSRFRVSASVSVQLAAFATGVPLDIYEFHLYTENSTNLSSTLASQFQVHFPG